MLIIKTIFTSIYKWLYSRFNLERPSTLFNAFIKLRKLEAIKLGRKSLIITGDSIVHFGEDEIERVTGGTVTAIGGDTVDTLYQRLLDNVLIYRPETVVFHNGGNSFKAGKSVEHCFEKLELFIGGLKYAGVKNIAWVEIIPLGNTNRSNSIFSNPEKSLIHDINFRLAPQLKAKMKKIVEVIEVRQEMAGIDGYIKEKYMLPDCIHINELAYKEAFAPAIKNWRVKKGISGK